MPVIQLGTESNEKTRIHKFPLKFIIAIFIKEMISIVGIILHEFSHYLMCVLLNVEIFSVDIYPCKTKNKIQFGSFEYEYIDSFRTNVLINLAPVLFNTFIGVMLIVFTIDSVFPQSVIGGVYYFIILSILAKAIPSLQDVKNLEEYKSNNIGISYNLIVYPTRKLAELSIYFVDYLLAITLFYILVI